MDNIRINNDSLVKCSKELVEHSDNIRNAYINKIVPVLKKNSKLVVDNKINNDDLINTFNSVFRDINNVLNESASFINNKVSPSYEELESYIIRSFNNDFANNFSNLIK